MKKLSVAIFILLLATIKVKADSPLTSTNFYEAYLSVDIVNQASTYKGDNVISDEINAYLANDNNPIDVRLAVVNALGWEGPAKLPTYFSYLRKHHKMTSLRKFMRKASADQLIIFAYMKALDNYNEVGEALEVAEKAIRKNKKSYAIAIVHGLILAQSKFSDSWCEVYKATDMVRKNDQLDQDLKPTAMAIIFDYMDLYKEDCDEQQ